MCTEQLEFLHFIKMQISIKNLYINFLWRCKFTNFILNGFFWT